MDKADTILLSYPRCGNTWVRYCIGLISGRRTISAYHNEYNHLDNGNTKPILIKCHNYTRDFECLYPRSSCSLILMIRDPKECIMRQCAKDDHTESELIKIFEENLTGIQEINFPPSEFIYNIITYDQWAAPKLLIYYEDLITKPETIIVQICDFLKIEIGDFLEHIEDHRSGGMKLYKDSKTDGRTVRFHSNVLSMQFKKNIDELIKNKFGDVFEKYLTRYTEV